MRARCGGNLKERRDRNDERQGQPPARIFRKRHEVKSRCPSNATPELSRQSAFFFRTAVSLSLELIAFREDTRSPCSTRGARML